MLDRYEIEIEYHHGRVRPWEANILINGQWKRVHDGTTWRVRGRKRNVVVRRAKKEIKSLQRRAERQVEIDRLRAEQTVEAAELKERFVVGE